ncbi:DoxX family protein [Streptomyces hoynatensis]|uniref:DoxX family protein n=1 Tax=Streptomyces hoynatensis TaxID=1141874 RepID=A0A3A9YZK8_9ACTN|nr:DoxX family protein [Streptomyces hoynatensis]RKN41179.1 DoxX family protein [Streptomyces hoynatensis]
MAVTSLVMSIVLAALILMSGAPKVAQQERMVTNAEHLGYSAAAFRNIGLLEVAAAAGLIVGLFWKPLGIAAAVGLVALMVGAVLAHRRAGDGGRETFPAAWVGLLSAATAVITVLGL